MLGKPQMQSARQPRRYDVWCCALQAGVSRASDFVSKELSKRFEGLLLAYTNRGACIKKYTATHTKNPSPCHTSGDIRWHPASARGPARGGGEKITRNSNISKQRLQIMRSPIQQYKMLISQTKLVIKNRFSGACCPWAETDVGW